MSPMMQMTRSQMQNPKKQPRTRIIRGSCVRGPLGSVLNEEKLLHKFPNYTHTHILTFTRDNGHLLAAYCSRTAYHTCVLLCLWKIPKKPPSRGKTTSGHVHAKAERGQSRRRQTQQWVIWRQFSQQQQQQQGRHPRVYPPFVRKSLSFSQLAVLLYVVGLLLLPLSVPG